MPEPYRSTCWQWSECCDFSIAPGDLIVDIGTRPEHVDCLDPEVRELRHYDDPEWEQ